MIIFPRDGLPPIVAEALRLEAIDWAKRGKIPSALEHRTIYLRVLERFGLECPHPVKISLCQFQPGAFECKMCKAYVIPGRRRQ